MRRKVWRPCASAAAWASPSPSSAERTKNKSREDKMARVAVVTGGTRGIGEAISVGLKKHGYKVAANYAGNDAAAEAFAQKYGIPVYKFDVGDFKQCQDAIKKITAELGPVDIVVNNAAITRDGIMHKMR